MTTLERFLNYISIDTTSNSSKTDTPSSRGQITLAKKLNEELIDLGIEDIHFDKDKCYLYAHIKGEEDLPKLGFVSHLDTSETTLGRNIKPLVHNYYKERDIFLNDFTILSPVSFPDLKNHVGKTLITSDGTTLLGADDKAGIAEIMQMLEVIQNSDMKHGDIYVCFTPDEEIGLGTKNLDFNYFNPDIAYTVDGCALGELSYENFNAATVNIAIEGVSSHLGHAKGIMKNSLNVATAINEMLPKDEVPEKTEGYEGFFHLRKLIGKENKTEMTYLIRDFDKEKLEQRINKLKDIVTNVRKEYNNIPINYNVTYSYDNMYEVIKNNFMIIEKTKNAMKENEIEPIITPIRGGTDGVSITFKGIPCPNIGTGGHNYHSIYEYIAVEDMEKVTDLLVSIIKEFSKEKNKQYTK